MAESLACGVPVLAFPHGAAPEIVDSGRTGFLCADEDDMARAVGRVGQISRLVCRATAERRFSLARMATDHVSLYQRVLAETPMRRHNTVALPHRPHVERQRAG
jgi:glycosyltransferase involved in cell wall biosynthesis